MKQTTWEIILKCVLCAIKIWTGQGPLANCLNAVVDVVARGLGDRLVPCSWFVRRVKGEYLVTVPGFKPKTFSRELQYSATSALRHCLDRL